MTLELLLEIQAHDTEIDRIEYLRKTLPELEELATAQNTRSAHIATQEEIQIRRDTIAKKQGEIEAEVKTVRQRRDSENERLYSGTVTAHKDLVAIQEELDMLAQRQNDLEDLILEQMELAEPVDAELEQVTAEITAVDITIEEIKTRIGIAEAELDTEIAKERSAREAIEINVSPELIEVYERARKAGGGLGVARLAQKRCMGCRVELPSVKLQELRDSDEGQIIYHDCGRILIP